MVKSVERRIQDRWAALIFVLVFVTALPGCASVQKKFTRKKAQPKYVAQSLAIDQGPHEKKFSNEYYYKTHYTYWKAWHGEWIDGLTGNRKRTSRNAEETVSHLEEMARYLTPEKTAGLKEAIEEIRKIQSRMQSGQYSSWGSIKVDLEKWRRIIASDYSFESAKEGLIPDTVDLGDSSLGA